MGSRGPVRPVAVAVPNSIAIAGKDIVVPMSILGAVGNDVISYQFDWRYDPSVIRPVAEPINLRGTLSRELFFETNAHEPGLLRVVVYGPTAIDGDGVLLNLRFASVGTVGSISQLSIENFMFNEGESRVSATDGQVKLF